MKTSRISSQIALFLVAALACSKLNAAITIYITPDGQNSDFQISGTFDGPMNRDIGNLAAFAFAPEAAWSGLDLGNGFSPVATIVNTTLGVSADITEVEFGPPYPDLGFFNSSLPVYAGNVLTLTSYGPVATPVPFADFNPGSYVFANPSLGPTTFYTYIYPAVPEPSPFALAGVGSILFLLYRRTREPNLRRAKRQW
jgi:hypothetical protein